MTLIQKIINIFKAYNDFEKGITKLKMFLPRGTDCKLYKEGLIYYRKKYQEYPVAYSGEKPYNDLFISGIKFGLSVQESYANSLLLTHDEFNMLSIYLQLGVEYQLNYDFKRSHAYITRKAISDLYRH